MGGDRTSADPQNASTAQTECEVAAFNDYNKDNLTLLDEAPSMPVDTLIAQRRLEEKFCKRFAQCSLKKTSDQLYELVYAAKFASCLEDESLEKYEAVRRDEK